MVNYEVMDLAGSSIIFKSTTHQKYFNIILVDLLSNSDEKVIGEQRSYLSAITTICQKPNFNENGSITSLSAVAKEFTDWLEEEIQVKTWLPSIQTEVILSIKR